MTHVTVVVQVITYICVVITLVCLLVAMLLMCILRGLDTNSNSIHLNLIFVIFMANLIYVAGIDATVNQVSR